MATAAVSRALKPVDGFKETNQGTEPPTISSYHQYLKGRLGEGC